jgi:hypothetical protein
MKNFILYIIIFLFCITFSSTHVLAQEIRDVQHKNASPERSAEGQTKWMISQLKLEPSIYKELYNINLKYFSRSDSVHSLSIALITKRESYLQYSQIRNDELKKVLSANQFKEYQNLIESIKANAKLVKQ